MATLGDIVIGLRMNSTQFSAGAAAARSQVSSLGSLASGIGGKMMGFAAAATAGLTVLGAARWGVDMAAQAEMSQASFATLLGDAGKAKTMLADLTGYAAKTPYSQGGIRDAAQTLLNFGVNARDVLPNLRMLGDVAMGSEEKFGRISLAFGQIASTGRLMGQDLLQLINAGFNPLQEISNRTGESMAALKKRMEDGKISFEEVRQAFEDATSSGGRFHGMAEKQSKTLSGLWSMLKDEVGLALGGLATYMLEAFNVKGWMERAIAAVNYVRQYIHGAGEAQNNADLNANVDFIRRREEKQDAIRKKNREDPFGFAEAGVDLDKWTKGLEAHAKAMTKFVEKTEAAGKPGAHAGPGGLFFDEKDGNYVSGLDAAMEAQKKKDWEDKSKEHDRDRRAAQRGAGAITAGSASFFQSLFASASNQQQDRMTRELQGLRRDFRDGQIAAVGVR